MQTQQDMLAVVIFAFSCKKLRETLSKGRTDEASIKEETKKTQRNEKVAMVWTL